MPAALTWCPRKPNSVVPNWHFSGPIIISYSAKCVRRIFKCFLCVRWSGLVTNKLYKYTNTKSNPRVTWSIKRWKVWPEFLKPNSVLVKLNKPKGVVTAVLCTSDGSTGTKSIFEKTFDPAKRWVKSCMCENRVSEHLNVYNLRTVSSLRFLSTKWSADDHSLSLGSITPKLIMSSNSFAVTSFYQVLNVVGARILGGHLSLSCVLYRV